MVLRVLHFLSLKICQQTENALCNSGFKTVYFKWQMAI